MLTAILVLLIVFWFLGYGPIVTFRYTLLKLGSHGISLWDVLIFLVIVCVISSLPRPLKEIATVVLVVWLLSLFGIIAVAGLSNILLIALIVGIGIYLIGKK
jgi:hypothetical protein